MTYGAYSMWKQGKGNCENCGKPLLKIDFRINFDKVSGEVLLTCNDCGLRFQGTGLFYSLELYCFYTGDPARWLAYLKGKDWFSEKLAFGFFETMAKLIDFLGWHRVGQGALMDCFLKLK